MAVDLCAARTEYSTLSESLSRKAGFSVLLRKVIEPISPPTYLLNTQVSHRTFRFQKISFGLGLGPSPALSLPTYFCRSQLLPGCFLRYMEPYHALHSDPRPGMHGTMRSGVFIGYFFSWERTCAVKPEPQTPFHLRLLTQFFWVSFGPYPTVCRYPLRSRDALEKRPGTGRTRNDRFPDSRFIYRFVRRLHRLRSALS